MKKILKVFTKTEYAIWILSLALILLSFFLTENTQYLYLAASLTGATALIFVSKGNVLGQILTVAFAVIYGIISYGFRYYGEMITYLGMTAPIAIASVVTWLKNPYKDRKTEVKVNSLSKKEYIFTTLLGLAVTIAFYFILRGLNTANLLISTISVLTSFLASYLTMRRSPLYALAYAANDIVLIIMWAMAATANAAYLSMVICFVVFFVNDLYGLFNWIKLRKRQSAEIDKNESPLG